jgi:F-type H+-transporting ATPase subunit b
MKLMRSLFLALVFSAFLSAFPVRAHEQTASQPANEASQAAPQHNTAGGELVEETEENENLKHSSTVRWLANKTNLSVHGAHLLASGLNFAIIAIIIISVAVKFLPKMFRTRTTAIQQALEEARAASQDANRRLADIENRLQQLNVEIGKMQATAEKEAGAEEVRIQKAAEEDIRKVIQSAEQEIAAAAKQARRELSNHTASLAIALARKQIKVDPNTDQVLVRTFATQLTSSDDGGKDGR